MGASLELSNSIFLLMAASILFQENVSVFAALDANTFQWIGNCCVTLIDIYFVHGLVWVYCCIYYRYHKLGTRSTAHPA